MGILCIDFTLKRCSDLSYVNLQFGKYFTVSVALISFILAGILGGGGRFITLLEKLIMGISVLLLADRALVTALN